jgi:hypothetical protein
MSKKPFTLEQRERRRAYLKAPAPKGVEPLEVLS